MVFPTIIYTQGKTVCIHVESGKRGVRTWVVRQFLTQPGLLEWSKDIPSVMEMQIQIYLSFRLQLIPRLGFYINIVAF